MALQPRQGVSRGPDPHPLSGEAAPLIAGKQERAKSGTALLLFPASRVEAPQSGLACGEKRAPPETGTKTPKHIRDRHRGCVRSFSFPRVRCLVVVVDVVAAVVVCCQNRLTATLIKAFNFKVAKYLSEIFKERLYRLQSLSERPRFQPRFPEP